MDISSNKQAKSHTIKHGDDYEMEILRELQQMDQRRRNFMTMHVALHPRDDIEWLKKRIVRRRVCQY